MRVRLPVLLLTLVLCASTLASASDRPPRDLHLVVDHWTAWNPPVPPEGAEVYVVQRGDTLWDLAAKFYSNPYLWPQIWEKNQYVLDAHWIYPGDPLEIVGKITTNDSLATIGQGSEGGATGQGGGQEAEAGDDADSQQSDLDIKGATLSDPVPLAAETDISCTGYVGDMEEEFPFRITGSESESLNLNQTAYLDPNDKKIQGEYGSRTTVKFGLSNGDILYLDGGTAKGMTAGAILTAIMPMETVIHPLSSKPVGRYYHYLGRVRVLSVQENSAIAEVLESCDPILVGAHLRPYEPEPVPLGRTSLMRPPNFPASAEKLKDAAAILYAQHDLIALGTDHVVQIDRGAEEDVTPGDIFTIYRESHNGNPPVVLGELAVLSVHKHSSVAKIIESRYQIRLGDRLELK